MNRLFRRIRLPPDSSRGNLPYTRVFGADWEDAFAVVVSGDATFAIE